MPTPKKSKTTKTAKKTVARPAAKRASAKKTTAKRTATTKPAAKRAPAKKALAKTRTAKTRTAKSATATKRAPAARPTQDEIRNRAGQIWVESGQRMGSALADWVRAEKELYTERGLKL